MSHRGSTRCTGAVPVHRLAEERAVMLLAPALKAPPQTLQRLAVLVESSAPACRL
jgi:hypothetical protein